MQYLEKINPSYFDLLMPLSKWKILNVKALKEESEHHGSFSGFYKIITKLEENRLIDSFINSWSNEKYIYLLPEGIKALGKNDMSLHVNREHRFHDAIVARVARIFNHYPHIENVYLDFQIRHRFPLLERVPDCLITGTLNKSFSMAIEVELTQKSKSRLKTIFNTYSDSKVVNQVLYITDKRSILITYQKYLRELGDHILKEKFLFLYAKDLVKGKTDLFKAPVYINEKQTTLNHLFEFT